MRQQNVGIQILVGLLLLTTACEKGARSYSLLGEQDSFQQNSDSFAQKKIDILWVIDNSQSMESSQENLRNNFASFINRFNSLGFDYHMAVTSSDAYLGDSFWANPPAGWDGDKPAGCVAFDSSNLNNRCNRHSYYIPGRGRFWDGATTTASNPYAMGKTGIFVMTPQNLTSEIFAKNISIGAAGAGDERAFSSFKWSLEDPLNTSLGFRRSDAFLAIIILSDEDDFSGEAQFDDHMIALNTGTGVGNDFTLNPVASPPPPPRNLIRQSGGVWVADLTGTAAMFGGTNVEYPSGSGVFYKSGASFQTTSAGTFFIGDKNYNAPAPLLQPVSYYVNWLDSYVGSRDNYTVSAIYVDSEACKNELDANNGVASRNVATRYPQIASLTNGQAGSLCGNFGNTLELITNKVIELASVFKLDRQPQVDTIVVKVNGVEVPNNATNGWTYDATKNAVAFHGTAVPAQGATINITYEPLAPI